VQLLVNIGSRIQRALWARLGQRSPVENRFLLLIPVVGAVTGLSAVGLAHVMAYIQKLCWGSGHNLLDAAAQTPWHYRLLVLVAAGAIVGLIGRIFRVETRGAGTAGMVQALALRGGYISFRNTWPRVLAGVSMVAMGASLGREGPMIQFGGALGSLIARKFKLSTQHIRILTCSAAAAAIAAVYNAPIGGTMMAMEVLIGNFSLEIFGPVVISSVISTFIFRNAMGDLPRFVIPDALRLGYKLVSGWELFAYVGLGILGGLVSVLFVRFLFWSEDSFEKIRLPAFARPVAGMLLVGGIGCFYPHVFGNGYEAVNLVLHENVPWELLFILPWAKLVATGFSLGSGGAGGLFMPTLMIGAYLGAGFGFGLHSWFPHATADYGAYALVGMGAVLAGTTHAPITAIMMIFEQTNSYQIVLPLMLVCIVSNGVARLLRSESVEHETLRRRGVTLPRGPEGGVMQTLRVADAMHDDAPAVAEATPFNEVVDRFLKEPYNNLYVTNQAGRFLGAIRLHALKDVLTQRDTLTMVVARDLIDEAFPVLTPDQKLADTMDAFWRERAERLPVVNNPQERRLIGWLSKRDLIGIYSQEILQKRQLLARFAVRSGDEQRETFVELPEGFELRTVELPAHHAGRTLAQLAPRSTYRVHVLARKRRDPVTGRESVEVPEPHTRLEAGDRLVVIGRFEDIAQFLAALALPPASA